MADFAPPPGPPPPKVPEGWKAVWNDQYSEWFYVNIYTKKSQWEKPTEPVYPPGEAPPSGPPPYYGRSEKPSMLSPDKPFPSNNPYTHSGGGRSSNDITEDERLARQLQEEENARGHAGQPAQGASSSYYQQSTAPPTASYGQQSAYSQPTQDQGKSSKSGLLGKLLGKASASHSSHQYGHAAPHGPPPRQYGGYGQPAGYYGGGGYPMGMAGRRPGGGMGVGGAAALGMGGGLLGGMMLGEMAADAGDGGDGGGDYGGDGGDYGGDGGDYGGGDYGGDMGGGDMGGGDF